MKKRGPKPFGNTLKEAAILELMKRLRKTRKGSVVPSYELVASELNEKGITRRSGATWTGRAVSKILNGKDVVKKRDYRRKRQLKITDYLTIEQVRLISEKLKPNYNLWVLFIFMVYTGVRRSEVGKVQVRDLDFMKLLGTPTITIRAGKGSKGLGKKWRDIKVDDYLVKVLRQFMNNKNVHAQKSALFQNREGNPFSGSDVYYRVLKMGELCGFDLHPHKLRHTYASFLYNANQDQFFVAQQLGHENTATTAIYAKTLDASKTEQLEKFHENLFTEAGS